MNIYSVTEKEYPSCLEMYQQEENNGNVIKLRNFKSSTAHKGKKWKLNSLKIHQKWRKSQAAQFDVFSFWMISLNWYAAWHADACSITGYCRFRLWSKTSVIITILIGKGGQRILRLCACIIGITRTEKIYRVQSFFTQPKICVGMVKGKFYNNAGREPRDRCRFSTIS